MVDVYTQDDYGRAAILTKLFGWALARTLRGSGLLADPLRAVGAAAAWPQLGDTTAARLARGLAGAAPAPAVPRTLVAPAGWATSTRLHAARRRRRLLRRC